MRTTKQQDGSLTIEVPVEQVAEFEDELSNVRMIYERDPRSLLYQLFHMLAKL